VASVAGASLASLSRANPHVYDIAVDRHADNPLQSGHDIPVEAASGCGGGLSGYARARLRPSDIKERHAWEQTATARRTQPWELAWWL
jgi:hypothetical protein